MLFDQILSQRFPSENPANNKSNAQMVLKRDLEKQWFILFI